MAGCIVVTRSFQTLIYFKLAVLPKVSTCTVAQESCTRVDTDAMLGAVGFSAVVNTVSTVRAAETLLTRTAVIWYQIWARAIICTRTGFAVINVFLALQSCKSSWTITNEAVNLWNTNYDGKDERSILASVEQLETRVTDGIRTMVSQMLVVRSVYKA